MPYCRYGIYPVTTVRRHFVADATVVRRVKRQRDVRLAEGWQEVRVWVLTEQEANDIRNLAADRRAKAKALAGLDEGIKSMPPETLHRIAEAIASQGSAAYTTPPVLYSSPNSRKRTISRASRGLLFFWRARHRLTPRLSRARCRQRSPTSGSSIAASRRPR